MPDETLLLLAREIRGKTLRILADVTPQQAIYAPPGLQNHILWHAGHALVVVEHLSVTPATGTQPPYPADWFDKFNWKSNPAAVKSWPSLEEVKAQLQNQAERLTSAISVLSQEQLNAAAPGRNDGKTLRYSILHGLHDEADHQGEMWLLRKLQTKGV